MRYQTGKLQFYGAKKDVEKAVEVLLKIEGLEEMAEGDARLKIQDAISSVGLKAEILYGGNTVHDMMRILSNVEQIIKHGTLYDKERPRFIPVGSLFRMPTIEKTILSEYTYRFLTNCCGSIAHYNIQGWVSKYSTVEDLKEFFKKNEYGKPVREWIPHWHTDALRIVQEIEKILFSFQHYMMKRREAECIDSR